MDELEQLRVLDWQILIWIPLSIITAIGVKKNWREIWDVDLSTRDRGELQKINAYFVLPLSVLFHECGHALATLWANGKVAEFHFAIWSGYVISLGAFSPAEKLIIDLAGTVFQLAMVFAFLIAALFVRSPAVVALLVYAGLTAYGIAVVTYPLLGLVGMYGDWVHIYTSPLTDWLVVVGVIHALLVVGFLYLVYGTRPRLWYSGKTRPKWRKDYLQALANVGKDPSAVNYLSLAWDYYLIGLDKLAWKTLDIVEQKDPNLMERYFLIANLRNNKEDTEGAVAAYETIVDSPIAQPITKVRALLSIGHSLTYRVEDPNVRKGKKPTIEDYSQPLTVYDQAAAMEPEFADAHYYKATILNKVGLHIEAEKELKDLQRKKWLDPALSDLHLLELKVARKSDNPKQ
ncbi:MAG: hypothetical protein SGJ27_04265 [Candidatus Melainabacteria bacterium]|mgnify:CR=1 FL=1|nr:hypothetical protein [Candidatus Melainabacteria bacterium]